MNKKIVNEIVEALLDETTLLKAYKDWDISPNQIRAAGKLRREASARLGQKIGVVSSDGDPYEEVTGSRAYTPFILSQTQKMDAKAGAKTPLKHKPENPSDRLRQKLYHEKPFVEMNVASSPVTGIEKFQQFVPVLGHELGHVVDPVQSEKYHAMSDLEGRSEMGVAYTGAEASENEKTVLKSEGRAWRMGRDMQKATGTFSPGMEKWWKEAAHQRLRSYTRPYKKG
jgi:hypothetical protein